jgi:hypothetical protein
MDVGVRLHPLSVDGLDPFLVPNRYATGETNLFVGASAYLALSSRLMRL